MSHSKMKSLHFYKYLCQMIGTEDVVKARRLNFLNEDFSNCCVNKVILQISSGSRAEGLNLNGSDLDVMHIMQVYDVYESENDCVRNRRTVFVMDTDDTPPCFTHLRFRDNYDTTLYLTQPNLQHYRGENLLSSDLFKLNIMNYVGAMPELHTKIHGPCISAFDDKIDVAICVEADQWVSQAQPWISRSRSLWPTTELISKIISCGVLFVPVGCKGSINENLQWRISFSIAEKMLIYSFSHTQLLCYALLKILLKEIIDRNEDIKGLLCSYFLKTIMFWISEETETSVWRPDNIIPCFMACSQRLLYCLEYSTLLHYFIPENNLFYQRFNKSNRNILINILKKSYQVGVQIFSSSQTLHSYKRFPCEITISVGEINLIMRLIKERGDLMQMPFTSILSIFNTLLHHCKTELSRFIFGKSVASTFQLLPIALSHINNPNNKMQYKNYKYELSQLLVGVNSDAISGWLKLALFFYVRKNYLISKDIINYSLSKCAGESFFSKITLKQTQKLKFFSLSKTSPSRFFKFSKLISSSSDIPKELQFCNTNSRLVCWSIIHNSMSFAHFLHFLCCYHLQDYRSCLDCVTKLSETEKISDTLLYCNYLISLGIAFQLLGEKERARHYFYLAAQRDTYNLSSAACKLSEL